MEKIDRKLAARLEERILELTADTIKKEFNLEVRRGGGTLGSAAFTLKLDISHPIQIHTAAAISPTSTGKWTDSMTIEEKVKNGLAPRGTPVITAGSGDAFIILESRRSRYLGERISDKKQYTFKFSSARFNPNYKPA